MNLEMPLLEMKLIFLNLFMKWQTLWRVVPTIPAIERVGLTSCSSFPVYLQQQTFTAPAGTSHACQEIR